MTDFDGKFRFRETFINTKTGKTSGSGFLGILSGLVACGVFTAGVVGWFFGFESSVEIMEKSLQLFGVSALLLGARKIAGTINGKKDVEVRARDSEVKEI